MATISREVVPPDPLVPEILYICWSSPLSHNYGIKVSKQVEGKSENLS